MILVPADFGQRHTARPRVRPQPPAPAFVNDETRRSGGASHDPRAVPAFRRRNHPLGGFPTGSYCAVSRAAFGCARSRARRARSIAERSGPAANCAASKGLTGFARCAGLRVKACRVFAALPDVNTRRADAASPCRSARHPLRGRPDTPTHAACAANFCGRIRPPRSRAGGVAAGSHVSSFCHRFLSCAPPVGRCRASVDREYADPTVTPPASRRSSLRPPFLSTLRRRRACLPPFRSPSPQAQVRARVNGQGAGTNAARLYSEGRSEHESGSVTRQPREGSGSVQ